jgi:hypothetical protein
VTEGGRLEDTGAQPTLTTVFVSDPTAEAERIAQALRGAGYVVVDVPLSMLIARVAVQHPRVILVDADGDGALDVVARMRELPDADAIDVLFIARPGGAVASPEQAMGLEGSGLFVRPVDVPSLVRKVEALTGGTEGGPTGGVSVPPPPSVPSSSRKRSSAPPSLPPVSMRSPESIAAAASRRPASFVPVRTPSEPPPSMGAMSGRRMVGLASPVSPELQQLLADAEQRAQSGHDSESIIPSPEDEIEAVLPAELLAALDEPMEEDEDDDEAGLPARSAHYTGGTGDGGGSRTTGAPTTGVGSTGGNTPSGLAGDSAVASDAGFTPAPLTHGGTSTGHTGSGLSTGSGPEPRADASSTPMAPGVASRHDSAPPPTAWSPAASSGAISPRPQPAEASFPTVLTPGDAPRVLARAVVQRTSGSLCFASSEAERRVVLREGDVVTTASTAEDESLLAFLGVRGDLPRETVRRLEAKFPPSGRHAGAALVARGYLRQDQMWPTLRAHAEWVLARALQAPQGRFSIEPEPPGRLAGEPSVFGGSTGAEVFVDLVRRIVPPAEAVEVLGGMSSRLADGPEARLFSECALGATEVEQLRGMAGRSLRDVLEGAPEGDLATVIFALSQLGVIEVLRGVGGDAGGDDQASDAQVAAIDAEGVRERVRARLQLVEDGDYFALLGVSHDATGYEVRRAFLELRRAFDPSRVLTPEVADLADDVKQITMVLEEAYDILKDSARRERYRRAIDALPGT